MRGQRKHLPPLNLLVAFEAAARLLSFTAAANELNLTQAAVSRQIRLLEESLGHPLFERLHRSIKLTDAGHQLLASTVLALNHIENACLGIVQQDHRPSVLVAATQSISNLWLLPKVKEYVSRNNDCEINIVSSDIDEECLVSDVDFAVLRGNGHWLDHHSERLLDEEIFPVCSPAFQSACADIQEPGDLIHHPLIEVAAGHEEWTNWKTWLTEWGIRGATADRYMTVNSYPLAINARR